jgi:Ca-activated chloride channel family protein
MQRCGALSVAGLLALTLALAQPPLGAQQQPTFRAKPTTIVPILVTVTDAEQRLVTDLVREDFEILDNDKPQPLVVFDNANQPFSVVVMLDTSGSMTLSLSLLRDAAEQFLVRLFPNDKAKVGAFNDKVQIGSRFSNNRDALVSDVKNLDYGNATKLWDAMATSLDGLKGIDGRRVVLIFTDGDDTDSAVGFGRILDRAREEEVMVYAIGLESNYGGVRTKPDSNLRKLAEETGGGYFELKKNTDLGSTFTRVAQELHSQYTLGFTPTVLDNKTHKLMVKLKQPGMKARARRNYVAKEQATAENK